MKVLLRRNGFDFIVHDDQEAFHVYCKVGREKVPSLGCAFFGDRLLTDLMTDPRLKLIKDLEIEALD